MRAATYCCGPPINNFDFALHKVFQVGGSEEKRFEFRAEFFNMFNHPQFITRMETSRMGRILAAYSG